MNRKSLILLIVVLGIIGTAFFCFADSGRVDFLSGSDLGNDGEEAVFPPGDETTYQMGIYLDTLSLTLSGTSIIETRNNCTRPLKELYFTAYPHVFQSRALTPAPLSAYSRGFDPGRINVTGLEVNGRSVEYILRDVSLVAMLPEDVLPDEKIDIRMTWEVKIPRAAYRFGTEDGVIMLSNFYPVLNVRRGEEWLLSSNTSFGEPFCFQCANYMVKVNVPSEFQVVSSGVVIEREAEANGRDTIFIEAREARDFVLVASWRHQVLQTRVMGTNLRCHILPGYESVGRGVLARAVRVFRYYSCTFGSYPYSELDIVQVPMQGLQGMEYSGVVFLRKEVFQKSYGEGKRDFLLAHEIAHQWWFGLVGNDQLREPWLDEGLANWSAHCYLKEMEGKSYPTRYNIYPEADLSRELGEMGSKGEYLATAYADGEAFWFALEKELGKEKVIRVLRRYLAEYRYRIATTRNLQKVIEEEAGKDMGPFYEKWFKDKSRQEKQ